MRLKISKYRVYRGEIWAWLSILCLIALSGWTYFTQAIRIETTVIWCVISVLLMWTRRRKMKKSVFVLLVIIGCVLIINYFINISFMSSANAKDYLILFSEIVCIALLVTATSLDEFQYKYVKILELISIISIMCFIIQITNFSLVQNIARTDIVKGYTISWFHTWGRTYIFNRNAGPFWEPGAYQGYLVIALLIVLKNKTYDKHYWELILLALTIATTMSTTGYVVLIILACYFLYRYSKNSMKKSKDIALAIFRILIIVVLSIMAIQYLMNSATVINKFSADNESYAARIIHLTNSFFIISNRLIRGYGMMSSYLVSLWGKYGVASNSVGIFAIVQYFGVLFGGIYVLYSLFSSMKVFREINSIIVLLVFIILHMTESLLTFPVYISFIFYALFIKEKEN